MDQPFSLADQTPQSGQLQYIAQPTECKKYPGNFIHSSATSPLVIACIGIETAGRAENHK